MCRIAPARVSSSIKSMAVAATAAAARASRGIDGLVLSPQPSSWRRAHTGKIIDAGRPGIAVGRQPGRSPRIRPRQGSDGRCDTTEASAVQANELAQAWAKERLAGPGAAPLEASEGTVLLQSTFLA
jgi:hypothetical protein